MFALDRDAWTQREFASRVGKSQPWLQQIVAGRNKVRLDDLDRVAGALGVPPAELIREPENELVEVIPDELRLLRLFRAMPREQRDQFLGVLAAAAESVKRTIDKPLQNHTAQRKVPVSPTIGGGVDERGAVSVGPEFFDMLTRLSAELADVVARAAAGEPLLAVLRAPSKDGGVAG